MGLLAWWSVMGVLLASCRSRHQLAIFAGRLASTESGAGAPSYMGGWARRTWKVLCRSRLQPAIFAAPGASSGSGWRPPRHPAPARPGSLSVRCPRSKWRAGTPSSRDVEDAVRLAWRVGGLCRRIKGVAQSRPKTSVIKKESLCAIYVIKCIRSRCTFHMSGILSPLDFPNFVSVIARPPFSLDGPHGSGHPDPDFSCLSFSTASNRSVARPIAGRPPATGSTIAVDRSTGLHLARAGTASG